MRLPEHQEARSWIAQATRHAERVLDIDLPWVLAHINDELTPAVLADRIPGFGEFKPVDIPYDGEQEGTVIWARDQQELENKLRLNETPLIIVSGTSTSGQNTVVAETMEKLAASDVVCDRVLTTTDKRETRAGEYDQVTPSQFDELVATGALVESMQRDWGRFGTRVSTLEAALDAHPDFAFLIVDGPGSRKVAQWMNEYYPSNPVARLFLLAKNSLLSTASSIMTRRPMADWLPRIEDTFRLIEDAGDDPTLDAVLSNLIDAGGVPIRTPQALSTFLKSPYFASR